MAAMDSGQVVQGIVIGDVIQVRAGGNVTIDATRPPYRVGVFSPAPARLAADRAARQPSRLLLARHAVVPFSGRTGILDDLQRWLRSTDPEEPLAMEPVAIRLLHGPGGQGKTRLAAEFAAQTLAAGWQVWQAEFGDSPTPTVMPAPAAGGGILVLVDYADRWPAPALETLVRHLLAIAENVGVPVRALLLARSAGFWWSLAGTKFDVEADELRLLPLADEASRIHQFADARDAFAAALGCDAGGVPDPPILTDPSFAHVLAVHMAALVAVDAVRTGRHVPASPQAISEYLLARERAYWTELHRQGADPLRTDPATLGRAVFTATLTGAMPNDKALTALTKLAFSRERAQLIVDDHRVCYPPAEDHLVLEPLHPDRLGEDFLALTLPGGPNSAVPADAWSEGMPELLAVSGVQDNLPIVETWTPHTLTVLIETAHRWPHVAQRHLFPLLRRHPAFAVAAGSAAMVRLAEIPEPDMAALTAVSAVIGDMRIRGLEAGFAAISQVVTPHQLSRTEIDEERGWLHLKLAERLERAGRREAARTEYTCAAGFYRRLARRDPRRFGPLLAETLVGLGEALAELNQPQDALTVTEEATSLARAAAAADSAHQALLAKCLSVLGARREDLGDVDAALASIEQAVAICHDLSSHDQAFDWHLAVHLTGLGGRLLDVGRVDDGVSVSRDSVDLLRRLSARRPEADHDAELAIALNNLAVGLRARGQPDQAAQTMIELIEVRRGLAQADPVNFEAALGVSLANTVGVQIDLGQLEPALRSAGEAVGILRRRTEIVGVRYAPELAQALIAASGALFHASRHEEALASSTEAVGIYQGLPPHLRRRHQLAAATATMGLASALSSLGRAAEAHQVGIDAVAQFRALPAGPDLANQGNLALAITNLGKILADLDRAEEARAMTEEAILIYRSLDNQDAALAFALANQALNLTMVKRPLEGFHLGTEAVEKLRPLAAANPDAHEPELARAISNVAVTLAMLGRVTEAAAMQAGTLTIWVALADRHPGLYDGQLAQARAQAALFADLVATRRPQGGQALIVAPEIQQRFGEVGVEEVCDSLFPVDCQTCGLSLTGSDQTLYINDLLTAAEAGLHHASCRASALNRPDHHRVLKVLASDGGMSWRSRSATTPFGNSSGRIRHVATVILNPALERVWLFRSESGAWQVRPHELFTRAGLVPIARFHLGKAAPGVRAYRRGDAVQIEVQGWPSSFSVPYADQGFVPATDDHRIGFLLVVTHALDPANLRRTADVRSALTDHRTVVGWVRITA
jgi:tetratricopeptide (TPR) repeat protein